MNQNTLYCKDGNTPEIHLQIQCNLYQSPSWLFYGNWQVDPKVHMEIQGTQNSQNNLEKEEQVRGLTLPDFRTYYTTVIKTMWHWHIDPSKESPETQPHIYSQLFLTKVTRRSNGWKNSVFNKWYWDSRKSTCRRIKLDPLPHIKCKN